jgi:hypothetical protein
MVNHMKTTVQIPDQLFEELRVLAHQEQISMKDLIQEGLRKVIAERKQPRPFRLRKATFKGNGLQPSVRGMSWDEIREKSYEGRGG